MPPSGHSVWLDVAPKDKPSESLDFPPPTPLSKSLHQTGDPLDLDGPQTNAFERNHPGSNSLELFFVLPQGSQLRWSSLFFGRHALDIREHYERKLERANNLYMELSAIMLQLEMREKELIKYVSRLLSVLPELGLSVSPNVVFCHVATTHS